MLSFANSDVIITSVVIIIIISFVRDRLENFIFEYFHLHSVSYNELVQRNYEYIRLHSSADAAKQKYEKTLDDQFDGYSVSIDQFYNIKIDNLKYSINILKLVSNAKYILSFELSILYNLNLLLEKYYSEIYSAIFD